MGRTAFNHVTDGAVPSPPREVDVTHDPARAMTTGDRIAIVNEAVSAEKASVER